jgi:hypothetical protein
MKKSFYVVLTTSILSLSTIGCAPTIKQSKIPSFLERLKQERFTKEQKVIVGDMLHYINDLETKPLSPLAH